MAATATPPEIVQRQLSPILGSGKYGLVSYPLKSGQLVPPVPTASSKPSPDLILIFGWMDGRLQHIQKYTELYNKIYPRATQVLVRSYGDFLYHNKKNYAKQMAPIIKLLEDYKDQRVLLHIFSNGGCLNLVAMVDIATKLSKSPRPIPATAIILDSCPGNGNFRSGVRAFTSHIKNLFVKWSFAAFVWTVFATVWLWRKLTLKGGDHFDIMRKRLLESGVLPLLARRTYIYSDTDPIIPFKAVEAHAEQSIRMGLKVDMVKFAGTPHVNHLKGPGNVEKYLKTIQAAWEAALPCSS